MNIEKIINYRNKYWNGNPYIPDWVDINDIDLDQFYTKDEIAIKCLNSLYKIKLVHVLCFRLYFD